MRNIVRDGSEREQVIAKQAMKELEKATIGDSTGTKIMYALSRGVMILLILVAVADVIMNVVALIDYYNRDHLPIPHYIVDMTTNKNEETSYVSYKSVRDNNGNPGDLNGGSSKQWLALYQTYDERAGAPIVAPGTGYYGYELKVYYGNSRRGSYCTTPLHMFGTPNVEQNLTNADGEKGWSYNDKRGGTYLYYSHYDGSLVSNKEDEKTGETVSDEPSVTAEPSATDEPSADTSTDETAVSGSAADIGTSVGVGMAALIGALCGVAGIGIGFAVGATRRKRKVIGDEGSGQE